MQHLSRYARTDWFGPLAITLVSIIVIGALHPGFLSPYNVQVLLLALAVNTLIALSQMVIIAIGQMNLAVGAIGGLAAISFAGMMEVWGLPAPLAGVLAICLGVAAGMLNGALITWSGISAFVITLAGLSVFKGINLGITRAQPFYGVPESVKAFGNTTFLGPLPWIIIPTAIVAVALWYLLNRLPLGRQILAVGGNSSAAELSGISVSRTVIVTPCHLGLSRGACRYHSRRPAADRSADHRRRMAHPVVCGPSDRRCRSQWRACERRRDCSGRGDRRHHYPGACAFAHRPISRAGRPRWADLVGCGDQSDA
jgi:ribose transport system permease protein